MDHPQTFQFSLLQAEDSLEDNTSLDNNFHDFCFNLCPVGFSDELIGESIQSELNNSSGTKGKVEDKLDSDLAPRPELANIKDGSQKDLPFGNIWE